MLYTDSSDDTSRVYFSLEFLLLCSVADTPQLTAPARVTKISYCIPPVIDATARADFSHQTFHACVCRSQSHEYSVTFSEEGSQSAQVPAIYGVATATPNLSSPTLFVESILLLRRAFLGSFVAWLAHPGRLSQQNNS